MSERFVSEPLTPYPAAIETAGMAAGIPGLPRRFTWDGRVHEIARVLESWRESGPERGRRGPRAQTYLRRHWWRIVTSGGLELKIYCERQLRRSRASGPRTAHPRPRVRGGRWWVYSAKGEENGGKVGK